MYGKPCRTVFKLRLIALFETPLTMAFPVFRFVPHPQLFLVVWECTPVPSPTNPRRTPLAQTEPKDRNGWYGSHPRRSSRALRGFKRRLPHRRRTTQLHERHNQTRLVLVGHRGKAFETEQISHWSVFHITLRAHQLPVWSSHCAPAAV